MTVRPGARKGGGGPVAPQHDTVYLDHAATSPMRSEVVEAMAPFAVARFGNASGSHHVARDARRALDESRENIAECLGADPGDVIFTSGGTEAANLAVLGTLAAHHHAGQPTTVLCSAVEHAAVIESCRAAERFAAWVTGAGPVDLRLVPVDAQARVDLGALEELLDHEVALVSVMLANSEVGTVEPLSAVAALVRRHAPRAVVHTDAVQAACYLDVASLAADADLVSLSAHKLGGPKGVGVLVARRPAQVAPLVHGGGQERERRSGTHDVAGAVGMATALRAAVATRDHEASRIRELRDALASGICSVVPGTVRSVDGDLTLPGHCHVRFDGIENEELLLLLDERGVCASAGSACASGALEPSPVLEAMGVGARDSKGSIRFTLGHTTTPVDVERAIDATAEAVALLRA